MTTQFVIEKNIPEPEGRSGKNTRYPLGEMQVGDSFFVPSESSDELKVRSAVSYFAIRHQGFRFSVRKAQGGVRVWRVLANGPDQQRPANGETKL